MRVCRPVAAPSWAEPHSVSTASASTVTLTLTLTLTPTVTVTLTLTQALVVDAPELRFSIETMPALKFEKEEEQVAFGHLNLKFESDALPVSARGLLAQLSGTPSPKPP